MRHQCGFMTAPMWKKTTKRDNPRLLYRSFKRTPLLLFKNDFFSNSNTWVFKKHPPQFINNNYVCIPKYNYYSIFLPLHLSIYVVLCSRKMTLFSLSIKKSAYTYIFIWKMYLHIHFYSKIGLTRTFLLSWFILLITPADLKKIIFYSFKVLLWSFIDVYWNEALKWFFKKTKLRLKCN